MIRKNTSDRGLAGVAALIVFIALVLVAAIAAAVILDVGGVLEQQAGETGMQASEQLSSQLNVLSTVGTVEEFNGGEAEAAVTELSMTVAASPGADNLNLDDVTIEVLSSTGAITLTSGDDLGEADVEEPSFGVEEVTSSSDEFGLVTAPEDRHTFEIDLEEDADEEALEALREGEDVELSIVTGPGGQTYNSFTTPSTLTNSQSTISL